MNELFSIAEYRQPLAESDRRSIVDQLICKARLGVRYMYSTREAAGLLHISYDEIRTMLCLYKLDCVVIRTAIRIPWWSLAEYLLDPADDLDAAVEEYIRTIPRRKDGQDHQRRRN
ncbi:MAG: hypothetical protein K2H09_06710 [Treponemataceae bacterium]|nr:hypothetical protein [Treponemataceae bacterium]